jgi:2',3'-cyclic-nucleotide 2'-phosphodiesterase (5'-nucleotidase family)
MSTRRDFLTGAGSLAIGLGPVLASCLRGRGEAAGLPASQAVRTGKAQHLTVLHTSDIHAQLESHDEFFYEERKPVFRRRGGFATLRTMIDALRAENPRGTLVVDGGDCFQGSAVAALSKGQAITPLLNRIGYDLVLPGNWEVVYGKEMLIKDMGMYSAAKVCANMFHAGATDAPPIFPPYQIFDVGGIRVGFIGYNDPLTPIRQSPAYSRGITFTRPERDLAGYVKLLRQTKGCHLVFVLSHLGSRAAAPSGESAVRAGRRLHPRRGHARTRARAAARQVLQGHRAGSVRIVRRQARSGDGERRNQGADVRVARRRPGAIWRRRRDEGDGRGGKRAIP